MCTDPLLKPEDKKSARATHMGGPAEQKRRTTVCAEKLAALRVKSQNSAKS